MATMAPTPIHIALGHPESGRLTIFWDDGSESEYLLADLRKTCPCATCRDLRDQLTSSSELTLLTNHAIDPSTEVIHMETVGRYAIQFTWKDGHNTGIYTYEFLREAGQKKQ